MSIAEFGNSSIDKVQEGCRAALYEETDRITQIPLIERGYETYEAVSKLALAFAAQNDYAGTSRCYDLINEPVSNNEAGVDRASWATVHFAGLKVGVEGADKQLETLLYGERNTIPPTPVFTDSIPECGKPYHASALEGIVNACERLDIPPNAWIDTYAVNSEHRYKLYMDHYLSMRNRAFHPKQAAQKKAYYIEQWQETCRAALQEPTLSLPFLYSMATPIVIYTDPALRKAVAERFASIADELPITNNTFNTLIHVGGAITQRESQGANEALMLKFDQLITEFAEQLYQREDTLLTREDHLEWRIAYGAYKGMDKEELSELLDTETGKMLGDPVLRQDIDSDDPYEILASTEALETKVLKSQGAVMHYRDRRLNYLVETYAVQGDFDTAAFFVAQIADVKQKTAAVQACLLNVGARGSTGTAIEIQEQIDKLERLLINPDESEDSNIADLNRNVTRQCALARAILLAPHKDTEYYHNPALIMQAATNVSYEVPEMMLEQPASVWLELAQQAVVEMFPNSDAFQPMLSMHLGWLRDLNLVGGLKDSYFLQAYLSAQAILAGSAYEAATAYDIIRGEPQRSSFQSARNLAGLSILLARVQQ